MTKAIVLIILPLLGQIESLAGAPSQRKSSPIRILVREVEYLELEEQLAPPDGVFGFFSTAESEIDRFPGWEPIPR